MNMLGFIGLGVMGEPMCRNLASKSGGRVIGLDLAAAPLERLAAEGVIRAGSVREVADQADVIFLSLPSGAAVEAVCGGDAGLVATARAGQTIVDLGTSPVALARSLAERFAARGAGFADAPVARTREAAVEDIRESMRLESFDPDTDLEVSDEEDGLTVYAGTGNADGIYYFIHVEEVR